MCQSFYLFKLDSARTLTFWAATSTSTKTYVFVSTALRCSALRCIALHCIAPTARNSSAFSDDRGHEKVCALVASARCRHTPNCVGLTVLKLSPKLGWVQSAKTKPKRKFVLFGTDFKLMSLMTWASLFGAGLRPGETVWQAVNDKYDIDTFTQIIWA